MGKRLPTLKPSKGAVYAMGAFLATFIFWFTRPAPEDEEEKGKKD
ncbi:MAG TPA: hypothetical protein VFV52_08640 [Bacilli bacterium]|nr:hypothetical protein [Bacilli bacterium]